MSALEFALVLMLALTFMGDNTAKATKETDLSKRCQALYQKAWGRAAETTKETDLTSTPLKTTTTRNPLHGKCAATPCSYQNASQVCGSDCECFTKNSRGKRVWVSGSDSSGFCELVI
uniref:Defensin n=1 Tax=Rhipicephalus zambeziensis TaxID=60191 RepID=A0A224Z228_9ACAR